MKRLVLFGLVIWLAAPLTAWSADAPWRVGVTLPVYGSWLSAIGGERIEVVAIVPADADPHVYRPRPADLERLGDLDVVIENGAHDPWLDAMLRAALGEAADALPRLRPATSEHSFLSLVTATREVRQLAESLSRLDPDGAATYRAGAEALVRRLRAMLAETMAALDALPGARDVPLAAVHDGYGTLFAELGLTLHAIVQPRHGVEPSARQLADTIRRLREADVRVLFTEMDLEPTTAELIERETGCMLARLDHVADGAATAERFEAGMASNLETIVEVLRRAVETP
ncbi:MAG: zinc ABC transporter substrate-binding protein [Acidobacteriota bacterium]